MLFDANGFPEEAAACYEECIADPDHFVRPVCTWFGTWKPPLAEYWDHLGRMREELGDLESAVDAYRSSLAENDNYGPTHRRLGRILLDLGDDDDGFRHLERASSLGDRTADSILRALDGGLPTPIPERLRLDDDPRLRAVLAHQGGPRQRLAWARTSIGWDRASKALPILQELATQNPGDVGVLGALVSASLRLDQVDVALDAVEAAERASPGNARIALVRGETLAARGDLGDAEDAFEQAVARQPDLAVAHSRLGLLRADRGDVEGAIVALSEARRLGWRELDTLLRLGVLERMTDRAAEAVTTFELATRVAPDSFPVWIFLARARGEAGDLPGAWEAHGRARALGPDRSEIPQVAQRLQELEAKAEDSDR